MQECLTFPRLYGEEWELYGTDHARCLAADHSCAETLQRNTQQSSRSLVHRQALERTPTLNWMWRTVVTLYLTLVLV